MKIKQVRMRMQRFLSLLFCLTLISQGLKAEGAFMEESSRKVSTQTQLKNVLIEEFTGIHCPNCPRGHQMAKKLMEDFYPYVYTIAFHTGGYAIPKGSNDPDFRTPYGDNLSRRLGIEGYPSGTINREEFKSEIIYSTSAWRKRVRFCHADTAIVNLHLDVDINTQSRVITLTVEGYYTKAPNADFHILNVALLQSNILGPQAGGTNANDYNHQHMIRDMISGLNGDTIKAPKQGGYFTKTYTYTVPADYTKIPVIMEDLQIIVFLEQADHEVLNVVGSVYDAPKDVPAVKARIENESTNKRYASEYFDLYVKNEGSDTIRNLSFEVQVNGVSQTCAWEGIIQPLNYQYITILTGAYATNPLDNTCKITLKGINKQDFAGNSVEFIFNGALETTAKIYMEFKTDLWGQENQILVKTLQGEIVYSKGPFPNNLNVVYKDTLILENNMMYSFEITDIAEDGLKAPSGYVKLYKADNGLLYQNYDIRATGDLLPLNTSIETSIEQEQKNELSDLLLFNQGQYIYTPNKDLPLPQSLSVYNMIGQQVFSMQKVSNSVVLPSLQKGIYLLKANRGEKNTVVLKFVVG